MSNDPFGGVEPPRRVNPFGDAEPPRRASPFGGDDPDEGLPDATGRVEHAARKIRRLRTQLGAEGLTLAAMRELIDEIAAGLDGAARALRALEGRGAAGGGEGPPRPDGPGSPESIE